MPGLHRSIRTVVVTGIGIAALGAGLVGSQTVAKAGSISYNLVNVGNYGGEPSLVSDGNGVLYDTSPSGPETFRSSDQGGSWTAIQSADTSSGDDCLGADESNAIYWCNLASSKFSTPPLQADDWKATSPTITTCVASCGWVHGTGVGCPPGVVACGTSSSVFGVDRDWTAASIVPPATTTAQAEVVLMYHDFYGPSSIWVNISHDGGTTFGGPQNIFAGAASTSIANAVEAEGYTFCNTVPSGVGIVKQKLPDGTPNPHAGRIYVSWIASDPAQDISGCNISMDQSFHTLWVAYSDDNGSTWSFQQAADIGVGHDASTPFAAFTLDDHGNPYIAFDAMDVASSTNVATCAAESANNSEQTDATCNYKTYVVWCQCEGSTVTFDGGGGLIGGSAATPYEVNPDVTGTSVFATIAAGDPGKVDVSWLQTATVVPTDPAGKFDPGGCAGNAPPNPTFYPPAPCPWNLFAAQSLNLTSPPTGTGAATWTPDGQLTSTPMHVGDICNLGIACGPTSDRTLLDFNMETVDPTTGCAHIAYADNNGPDGNFQTTPPSPHDNHLVAANQVSGPSIISGVTCGLATANTPEVPTTLLLPLAGAAAVAVGVRSRRWGRSKPTTS